MKGNFLLKIINILLLSIFLTVPIYQADASIKIVRASWYDCSKKGECSRNKIMANGKKFNPNAMTAAHKYLRLGTLIEVTNLKNGRKVIVRITDRGPYVSGRELDLSRAAAKKLNMITSGTQKVKMRILK